MPRRPDSPEAAAGAAPADWAGDSVVWDVIVVGAGPAGSTAARTAALGGARVLLLDRARFPRYKTCGGGLLGESLALIPASARRTIESSVRETVFTDRFRRGFTLRRPDAYLAMVRRQEFDQALVDAAVEAGVRFVDGVTVRGLDDPAPTPSAAPDADAGGAVGGGAPDAASNEAQDAVRGEAPNALRSEVLDAAGSEAQDVAPGEALDAAPVDPPHAVRGEAPVAVRTDRGVASARVVIGADGAGGRIGRHVGVDLGGVDLGLEDEVALPDDDSRWRDRVFLDWGAAAGSYAWVFPKADSLTVGVIQRKGAPDETRAYLAAWRRHLGLHDAPTLHSSGHLTQWRTPSSPLRRGRVIVAGESAGLLEPWTREGISFALRSGQWAGEAAAADAAGPRDSYAAPDVAGPSHPDALDAYVARVRAVLEPEQRAGARILAAFERRRGLVHTLLRTPAGARYFVRFCRGETTLARLARHRLVMRVVRTLS